MEPVGSNISREHIFDRTIYPILNTYNNTIGADFNSIFDPINQNQIENPIEKYKVSNI